MLPRPREHQPRGLYREERRPSSSAVKITTELKAGRVVAAREVTRAAFDGAEAAGTSGEEGCCCCGMRSSRAEPAAEWGGKALSLL